ncbi:hypothetical protein [Streptomyces sp. NPDC093514]|uniref:hypothetical protein n=1 Tax=Streptomyces sp. NPDC093514 TaxID=3366039 RepID=UPI003809CDC8
MIKRWIFSVFLALFLSSTGYASAAPAPPVPPPGGSWIKVLRWIAGEADHGAASLPHSVDSGTLSRLRSDVDGLSHQLATVPRTLSADELAALNRALAAHYGYRAAVSHLSIPLTATSLVDNVRPPNYHPQNTGWVLLKNDLKKKAEDYLKEFACAQSWNALTPERKQEVNSPPPSWSEETVKASINAVAEKWRATLVGQYFAWNNFTTGVFEKMEQLASQGHLTAPAQAYVYYARYCLTPP